MKTYLMLNAKGRIGTIEAVNSMSAIKSWNAANPANVATVASEKREARSTSANQSHPLAGGNIGGMAWTMREDADGAY